MKKAIYYTLTGIFFALALVACALMCLTVYRESEKHLETIFSFLLFVGVCILFAPSVVVHECGHLFFGLFARMKPVSVRFGWLLFERKKIRFSFSQVAGRTQFLPMGDKNVRKRISAVSYGGAIFNFIYGLVFCVLFFTLPYHPVLFFFELFAPLHLFEGFCALLPAELPAGRTDGELIRLFRSNAPEAQTVAAVLTVQGILSRETFDSVDENMLFGLPVVREDEPAFLSLLHLRWQFLMWRGDVTRATTELNRLEELGEYLDDYDRAQVICDALFMRRIVEGKSEKNVMLPAAAKGTCAYFRAELAMKGGNIAQYKKIAAQETATGIRALESMFFERFIQNF